MFNNLIESSSHAQELKRRGSFLLFTTATYLVLFLITGVASIYAYDAHLETQNTELEITFLPVLPTEEAPTEVVRNTPRSGSNSNANVTRPMRTEAVDSASNPTNIPETIGTVRSPALPWVRHAVIGPEDVDLPSPGGNRKVPGGTGNTPVVNIPDNPPPPALEPKRDIPKVVRVSDGVLKGKAISLPTPTYPEMAKRIRLQGVVTVQVLIDETGKVLSAQSVNGHPLLAAEAIRAARQARFSPTKLGDQAVKVSGLITYDFRIQQ